MLVNALLIEAYREADSAITGDAVLCAYDRAQWMGVRRGPADAESREARPAVDTVRFPRRTFPIERGRRPRFTTEEPWTVPAWTVYIVSPPADYYLRSSHLDDLGGNEITRLHPASDSGSLYYYALLQGDREQVAFGVDMRFECDPRAAQRLSRPGVGGRNWQRLWHSAAEPLSVAGDIASVAELIHMIGLF